MHKTFQIDGRWYEMELISILYTKDLDHGPKYQPCSIWIPGVGGFYEMPLVNTGYTMIYGGRYCMFRVLRDFGAEEGKVR